MAPPAKSDLPCGQEWGGDWKPGSSGPHRASPSPNSTAVPLPSDHLTTRITPSPLLPSVTREVLPGHPQMHRHVGTLPSSFSPSGPQGPLFHSMSLQGTEH